MATITMNTAKMGTDNSKRGPSYAINLLGWLVHTIRTMDKPHADDASALSAFLANCEGVKIRLERMVKDEKATSENATPVVSIGSAAPAIPAPVKPVAPTVKPSAPVAVKLACKVCGSAVPSADEMVDGACVECLYADVPAPAQSKPSKPTSVAQNKPDAPKPTPAPVQPVKSAESDMAALRLEAKALGIRGYALPSIKPETLARMIAERKTSNPAPTVADVAPTAPKTDKPVASHKPVSPLNAQGEEMDAKQIRAAIKATWGKGYAKAGMNRAELAAVHARLTRIDDEKRIAAEAERKASEEAKIAAERKASEEASEETAAPTMDLTAVDVSLLIVELGARIGAKRGPGSKAKNEEAFALLSKLNELLS
jgi:hypothetical protein